MNKATGVIAAIVGLVVTACLVVGALFGVAALYRTYGVWSAEKVGEAEFAQAEQNRQIKVEEARADLEAAKFYSLAEIERARGVAEANEIIADGLGGPEGYLRYLYIQQVSNNDNQVIYLPTEAGVPILEAGKR